jgi:hypothetical protein
MKIEEMAIEITETAMNFIKGKMEKENYGLLVSYNEIKN